MQALACQLQAEDRLFQFEFKGQERPRPSSRQAGSKSCPCSQRVSLSFYSGLPLPGGGSSSEIAICFAVYRLQVNGIQKHPH